MSRKSNEELLAPRGDDPGADYIRGRLKKRVELERGITMRSKQVDALVRCLDRAATLERIEDLHSQAMGDTSTAAWGLQIEALLNEMHGEWRYDGRPEILRKDMEKAARHYAVSLAMDALLQECDFPVVRTTEERVDDAAWYAVPAPERG